jgi:hypothetical protein
MRKILATLWNDDGGSLIAAEWLFVTTILVIGVTVGLVAVRNAVTDELTTMANSIDSLNPCYSFSGQKNCESSVCGSAVQVRQGKQIETHKIDAASTVQLQHNPCATCQ